MEEEEDEGGILYLEAIRLHDNPSKQLQLLKQSAKLGNKNAAESLYLRFFYRGNWGNCAKYAIKRGFVPDFLDTEHNSPTAEEHWVGYWRIGREVFFAKEYVDVLFEKKVTMQTQIFCRRIFIECQTKTQACIFTWLLCCKKSGFQKDVARLIAKIIWKKYRKDPTCWYIWEIEENKKLKRG